MTGRIAFITTCKGRLHHLKQTLPTMAAQQPDELIVVDYACQDGAGDWAEAEVPGVRVIRASQPDGGFNVGRARNLGAAAASSEWLFFIDADIGIEPGFAAALRKDLRPGHYYRARLPRGSVTGQAYGTFCCEARAFAAAGGYDEVMEGWGYEDRDLYERLALIGCTPRFYPPDPLRIITHDDDERHLVRGMRDRAHNEAINACYSLAKRTASVQRGGRGDLPLAERRALMGEIRRIVGRWYENGARGALPVRVKVASGQPVRLASQMQLRSEVSVTVLLEPPPAGTPGHGG